MGALLYLALFGSVIAFGAYFTLVGRIGASKAAYSTLLFPLVALTISTFYEGYVWHSNAVIGLALILVGNLVMFARPEQLFMRRRLAILSPSGNTQDGLNASITSATDRISPHRSPYHQSPASTYQRSAACSH